PSRVVICTTCGQDNPAHLVFCQMCGQRLGPRVAPPTPPIGIVPPLPANVSPAAGAVAPTPPPLPPPPPRPPPASLPRPVPAPPPVPAPAPFPAPAPCPAPAPFPAPAPVYAPPPPVPVVASAQTSRANLAKTVIDSSPPQMDPAPASDAPRICHVCAT